MRSRFLASGALTLALAATFTGPAWATPSFNLRVEAPGATLDPGTFYAPPKTIAVPKGETSGGA